MRSEMKLSLVLFVVLYGASASAAIIRCVGTFVFANEELPITLDIVTPSSMDLYPALVDEKGQAEAPLDNFKMGLGIIEITTVAEPKRYDFVFTREPSSKNSLIGFYLDRSYVYTLRADLWKKEKPFLFFDSFHGQTISGRCE